MSGNNFCNGDVLASSTFVDEVCHDGNIVFKNKISGLKFKKSLLAKKSKVCNYNILLLYYHILG